MPWGAIGWAGTTAPLGLVDADSRVLYFGHGAAKQIELQPKAGTTLVKLDGGAQQVSVLARWRSLV